MGPYGTVLKAYYLCGSARPGYFVGKPGPDSESQHVGWQHSRHQLSSRNWAGPYDIPRPARPGVQAEPTAVAGHLRLQQVKIKIGYEKSSSRLVFVVQQG
jgi:hypothetical protein